MKFEVFGSPYEGKGFIKIVETSFLQLLCVDEIHFYRYTYDQCLVWYQATKNITHNKKLIYTYPVIKAITPIMVIMVWSLHKSDLIAWAG